MISRFFIDRPIFAWVIAIVIMMAGALSISSLPIAQYPDIALPQVAINAVYPGASAKTVEDSVTQVIEQKMKGLDGLEYISSASDGTGSATVTLTFKGGTDIDIAQVQVQNKLQTATALLPQEVQQQGLSVVKSTRNFLLIVSLVASDGKATNSDLADYMAANLQDPISRVDGVGDVQLFGAQYAMRIWLDPEKLTARSMTPADVITAIRAQNAQVSAGQLGGTPSTPGTVLNATISAQARLQTPAQFENIILRDTGGGTHVYLRDVARVELGAENYNSLSKLNGKSATGLAIKLAPGGNALQTADAVKAKVAELSKDFPPGIEYTIPVDSTPFVKQSIEEVVKTLVEAVVLVFLVMFLFLQNWRATLIPTIAVPVVLLGTLGVLAVFGYSINTLTMFGLVLAIGLLVDDAIVVVENVERVMQEEGLSPKDAARRSMDEITGALVGVALVLAAVFVPMAFFGGSQGVIYRQFSVTLVTAMALSVLVALVLTPALCATLLKPADKDHHTSKRGFFGWFNRNFDHASHRYQGQVQSMLGKGGRWMAVYAAIVVVMALLFMRLPTAFLPEEDQGQIITLVQLPPGATEERTQAVLKQVSDYYLKDEAESVEAVFTISGFSFSGAGQNAGLAFVRTKGFGERKASDRKVQAIAQRAMQKFGQIRDAQVFAVVPPAVPELGTSSGFDFQLQDTGGVGHEALMAARNQLLGMAGAEKTLVGVRPNGQDDTPQFVIDVDQAKAGAMGLTTADINATLSTALGGSYVNDFIDRGRVKKVFVQADAPFRMTPEDLDRWYVRNGAGQMAPFSSFASTHWAVGSPRLERYNGLPSVNVQGSPAPGQSSGQAMAKMEELAAKLPPGIGYEWTGLSLQEREAGAQAPALYAISIIVVFLLLAALYESWTIPLSVILVIPLGVIGAVLATSLRGLSNDIYFQVGLLTTMGLAAKNAILIVEFAKDRHEGGASLIDATLEAVRIRLRPIIMTSLAFVFGVLPLAISNGPGSGSQHAIGTGVIGGMVSGVALAIFFVPLFFVLVQRHLGRKADPKAPPEAAPQEAV
ncbi:MAG: efflux RND transporter permease subunit [Alphaproteobacteria bacterium]|nr:efflux RND transporter permease subunit [Alphaproteobacteria bacterium]MBU1517156.1 efflux RND transporter permease subunit [Alphaproteobacteria bacterium]MBU2096511.1 efflux RND transporter permease subunit [Alphaproteobacteria bacterium]MBU2151663.1 efflux RND transporter permease subunit [Alphaproteobacteria bacterium]MBU2305459.1 efflux RND transporter permease subunit [Alphaproteobacteria bacterium]